MDPQTDLPDLVEDLEVNIDELTTTLLPLLPPTSLSKTATTLPLLEKAKLHVLAAYAIESTLFSALLASGTDAKAHPLFAELARLKTYFAKIRDAEESAAGPRQRIDKDAAARFIRHGLSGNERYDELRRERVVRERERAVERARAVTNRKFEDEEAEEGGTPGKRGVEVEEGEEEGQTPAKKVKVGGDVVEGDDGGAEEDGADDVEGEAGALPKKRRGRPAKKDAAPVKTETPTRATRSSAPKTRSEAFQALAAGSPASATKAKGKGRGKGKAK